MPVNPPWNDRVLFRDPEAWEALRTAAVLPLLETGETREPLRAWVVGCAGGEDAYALGILVIEEAERLGRAPNIRIFATDSAVAGLDRARSGDFPPGIEAEMDPQRLERFFQREKNDGYQARRALRQMIVFAPHDLLRDPPISRLDLCICRRLGELQDVARRQAVASLHFSLREGGILFFSPVGANGAPRLDHRLFAPISREWPIYRRIGRARTLLEPWSRGSEGWIPAERLRESEEALEAGNEELQCLNEELATMNLELRAKVAELEATTNDLTHVLGSTDIALLFLDRALRIRRFTRTVEDLFQLIPADVGRPIGQLAPKFEGDDLIDDALAVLEDHPPRLTEVRSHTGRWYVRRVLPYRADRRIDGVVVTFVDITERRRAEELFREQTEAASRAKDEFIAAVSHELRTPLQPILMWAAALKRGMVPEPLRAEGLVAIERAAAAQARLIDDLLDVSRMISGKLQLLPQPTRLVDIVSEAVGAIRQEAEERSVTLDVALDAAAGVVQADPDRLRQVVSNLVQNAVKFTPDGGRVAVALERRGREVEIRVADTGVGIAAEFLPRVFDRFDQGEAGTTRRNGGLGLGLAIAKQLVELHGGRIEAASDGEGQGATFTVRLPLPRLEDPLDPRPAADDRSREALRGRRILLVEDSAATRDSVVVLLAAVGAQVTAVDGASAALESLATGRPEILVSDIAMPGCDGYELLREVRRLEQHHGWQETPAVALSAHARREDRRQAIEAGFHEHLAKPIDPDQLIATLARLVG